MLRRKDGTMARSLTEIDLSSGGSFRPEPYRAEANDPTRADPRPGEEMHRLKAQLHRQLVTSMDLSALATLTRDQLRLEVRRVADELCQRSSSLLNRNERERLVNEVLDETFGLGPLEQLMKDPSITDILINGYNTVYVERNGVLEPAPVAFADGQHLLHIVQRIVGQ